MLASLKQPNKQSRTETNDSEKSLTGVVSLSRKPPPRFSNQSVPHIVMPSNSRNFAGAPIKHYSEDGIQPLNSGSKTSASTKIEIKTLQPTATHQRRLESPTDLAVKFITCNSAELVWSSPVFMAKHDVSYRVRYWPKKQHRALAKTLISQETYCRLEKLTPETPYMIHVVAISSDGQQTIRLLSASLARYSSLQLQFWNIVLLKMLCSSARRLQLATKWNCMLFH